MYRDNVIKLCFIDIVLRHTNITTSCRLVCYDDVEDASC